MALVPNSTSLSLRDLKWPTKLRTDTNPPQTEQRRKAERRVGSGEPRVRQRQRDTSTARHIFQRTTATARGRWTHSTFKQMRCSRSTLTGTLTLLRHNTKTTRPGDVPATRWPTRVQKCPLLHRNVSLQGQCQTQSDILSFDRTKLYCKRAVLKPIRCKCTHLHSVTVYTSLFLLCNLYLKVVSHPTRPDPTRSPSMHSHFSVIQQHPVHGVDGPVRSLLSLKVDKAVAFGAPLVTHNLQQTR